MHCSPQTLDLKECFDFFNEKSVAAADPAVHSVIAARNQWPAGQVGACCRWDAGSGRHGELPNASGTPVLDATLQRLQPHPSTNTARSL